jgi:hypothetical protein
MARLTKTDAARQLGIAKAGNRHIRALAIEIAWGWLRYQPTSALSQWYQSRFGAGGPRLRKTLFLDSRVVAFEDGVY